MPVFTKQNGGGASLPINESDVTNLVADLAAKASASSLSSHIADTANPHAVTKAQVGLSAVANALQLVAASNLGDLSSNTLARANLGVYSIGTTNGLLDTKQPLDATLTALAGLTISADSLTIGTGTDAFAQTTFATNTFPARASSGNLAAKSITDFGLSLVDDADASTARTTLGLGTAATSATTDFAASSRTISTTAPLSGGGALSSNLTLTLSAASGSAAGSMSAAHYTLVNGATSVNTASTIVKRGDAGEINASIMSADQFSGDGSGLSGVMLNVGPVAQGPMTLYDSAAASYFYLDPEAISNGGIALQVYSNGLGADLLTLDQDGNAVFAGTLASAAFVGNGINLSALNATNLTSGTVADGRLSSNIPLKNAANTFTAAQTIASGTITSSAPAINVTQTWNASGVTFTAWKCNVTNTASAAASLLLDLQVGSVSKFKVDKTGLVTATAGTFSGAIDFSLGTWNTSNGGQRLLFNGDGSNYYKSGASNAHYFRNVSDVAQLSIDDSGLALLGTTLVSVGTQLELKQTGDGFGASSIIIRNRSGQNGLLLKPYGSNDLVDLMMCDLTEATIRNVRFENRGFATFAGTPEIQLGVAGNPTLCIADGSALFRFPVSGTSIAASKVITSGVVTLTDASTITVNAALGNTFDVTLGGNRTLGNPSNSTTGQKILFRIKQDGTGSRTLAYDTKYRFGTDIPSITLTTTASKTDFIGCVYNVTDDKWDVVSVVKGY